MSFPTKCSSWYHDPYALALGEGIIEEDGSIKGIVKKTKVVISLTTIVVASGCTKEGLMFDKDKEKSITQEIIDKLLYD